jgi:hypothetical protein
VIDFQDKDFERWVGLHYLAGGVDGGKFVVGVERAVARLSDGARGPAPFQVP